MFDDLLTMQLNPNAKCFTPVPGLFTAMTEYALACDDYDEVALCLRSRVFNEDEERECWKRRDDAAFKVLMLLESQKECELTGEEVESQRLAEEDDLAAALERRLTPYLCY